MTVIDRRYSVAFDYYAAAEAATVEELAAQLAERDAELEKLRSDKADK